MTSANISQCPLCKGVGTVNRVMICPRCDGEGILDAKVIAAEYRGRQRVLNADSPAAASWADRGQFTRQSTVADE